jgi:hypothetical protein
MQKGKHPALSPKYRAETGYVSTRHDYYSSYYQRNKKAIMARKKELLDSSATRREYYKRMGREWRKEHRKGTVARTIMLSENNERLYTIVHAANATGLSIPRFRDMIKSGIIPEASIKDARGWRLYTEDQIGLIRRAMHYYMPRNPLRTKAILQVFWEDPKAGLALPVEKCLDEALKQVHNKK